MIPYLNCELESVYTTPDDGVIPFKESGALLIVGGVVDQDVPGYAISIQTSLPEHGIEGKLDIFSRVTPRAKILRIENKLPLIKLSISEMDGQSNDAEQTWARVQVC